MLKSGKEKKNPKKAEGKNINWIENGAVYVMKRMHLFLEVKYAYSNHKSLSEFNFRRNAAHC